MARLEDSIMKNEKHKNSNCFVMVIICHGNNRGQLKDVNKHKAWDIEDLIGDLSKVETLVGKPKIMILQCCRGGLDFFPNRPKESCCSPSIKWTNGVFTLPNTDTDTDAMGVGVGQCEHSITHKT